jgi:hypothetical protein
MISCAATKAPSPDLSGTGAARLLVIVSDGVYELARRKAGEARVAALRATGCGVLWLAPDDVSPFDGCTMFTLTDPTTTATTIVRAATAALRPGVTPRSKTGLNRPAGHGPNP